MERFDELVTDRRLRRDELLAWIESRRRRRAATSARYRVMTTSGSSGRKGLFVYDPARLGGDRGAVPALDDVDRCHARGCPRLRLAIARRRLAHAHEPCRASATLGVGVHRVARRCP